MVQTLHIKNMVCNRCKTSVLNTLEDQGFKVVSVELGQVIIQGGNYSAIENLGNVLNKNGFEIIRDETEKLIEEIKISLIKKLDSNEVNNLATFLTRIFNKSYSSLSKLFSRTEGITIEKYLIRIKIERAKELIQLGQLNFSEIAYSLGYKSSSHLARQFKSLTGMSMTEYKSLQKWDRKMLDQII